jgi:hypothetical protein
VLKADGAVPLVVAAAVVVVFVANAAEVVSTALVSAVKFKEATPAVTY